MNMISAREAINYLNITDIRFYTMVSEGEFNSEKRKNRTYVNKHDVIRKRPTVLTCFNHKLGSGKTSTAIDAADYFSSRGFRTLFVDLDPQARGTEILSGSLGNDPNKTLYEFFENKSVKLYSLTKKITGDLDLLPADIRMINKDSLPFEQLYEYKINDFYSNFKKYEIVIVDCPSTLGALSRLGVLLSNYLIMPMDNSSACLRSTMDSIQFIKGIKPMNKGLIDTIVFNSKLSPIEGDNKKLTDKYNALFGDSFISGYSPEVSETESLFAGISETIFNNREMK